MIDREALIENNLGLVHSCAAKFRGRGVDYEDLFQAGCVGLCKAADGFDESLGFVFSTYAVPAILGEIKRVFRDGGAVKVSRSLKERAMLLRKEAEAFSAEAGREPTVFELSERLGINPSEVSELLLVNMPAVSLTQFETDNENDERQMDISSGNEEEMITERLSLEECVKSLCAQDRLLIELRFYKSKTQSFVAERLGMSQVQVSRREKKILRELREKLTV